MSEAPAEGEAATRAGDQRLDAEREGSRVVFLVLMALLVIPIRKAIRKPAPIAAVTAPARWSAADAWSWVAIAIPTPVAHEPAIAMVMTAILAALLSDAGALFGAGEGVVTPGAVGGTGKTPAGFGVGRLGSGGGAGAGALSTGTVTSTDSVGGGCAAATLGDETSARSARRTAGAGRPRARLGGMSEGPVEREAAARMRDEGARLGERAERHALGDREQQDQPVSPVGTARPPFTNETPSTLSLSPRWPM